MIFIRRNIIFYYYFLVHLKKYYNVWLILFMVVKRRKELGPILSVIFYGPGPKLINCAQNWKKKNLHSTFLIFSPPIIDVVMIYEEERPQLFCKIERCWKNVSFLHLFLKWFSPFFFFLLLLSLFMTFSWYRILPMLTNINKYFNRPIKILLENIILWLLRPPKDLIHLINNL